VDADGSPSFLEKALKFIEDHGNYFCLLNSVHNHEKKLNYGEPKHECLVITHTQKKLSVGVKVEGILRQSADVEEVKRRVRDYEKGDFFLLNLLFSYLG